MKSPLTMEKLKSLISEALFEKNSKPKDNMIMGQYCLTKGFVIRDSFLDLNLCSNPKCYSCSNFKKEIEKQINEIQ